MEIFKISFIKQVSSYPKTSDCGSSSKSILAKHEDDTFPREYFVYKTPALEKNMSVCLLDNVNISSISKYAVPSIMLI